MLSLYMDMKFQITFSSTLSSGTTFHIRFVQKHTLFNSILNHIDTQQYPLFKVTEEKAALVFE
jgi:hypothetical protein